MKKIFFSISITVLFFSVHAQNVGIGTTTPTEKLHVAGNIRLDTIKPNRIKLTPNAGEGKVLTSDASGNASWQELNTFTGADIGFGTWGDCQTNSNIWEYHPISDTAATSFQMGESVCVSGNFAISGSPYETVGVNTDQGTVIIFRHNGNQWIPMQKITDATGAAFDRFGTSVSISGNYAIVGSYMDDVGANSNQGSASIYQYNGTSWVLMQKITDAAGAADDYFGFSVCISGNYAIIGAYQDNVGANNDQGSASIYQYNGASWVLINKITDPAGAQNDYFGYSVSINGDNALVGSWGKEIGANNDQGNAHFFHYDGSNWVYTQTVNDQAIVNAGQKFGWSVSISGNYALIGAYGDDLQKGAGLFFHFNGSTWVFSGKVKMPDGQANDFFGNSVCITGNYAIIGTPRDNIQTSIQQGSVSIYQRVANNWQRLQYLPEAYGSSGDQFGNSVSIDGTNKRFMVGAHFSFSLKGKVVFGKIK